MSKARKIVLANHIKEPIVIISENPYNYKGIILSKEQSKGTYCTVDSSDIVKDDNYRGKKLENRNAFIDDYVTIYNLNVREIGALTESGYFKLLKNYVSKQVSMGGTSSNYLLIREDIHNQLIKMMKKK